MVSSLNQMRVSDFELVPKTTFPIRYRHVDQKIDFGQKIQTAKFRPENYFSAPNFAEFVQKVVFSYNILII